MVSSSSIDAANTTANEFLNFTLNATQTSNFLFDYPPYLKTTSIALCTLILIFGVVGNVMVPVVIMRTKDMRNSTNIFLMNLSLADLLVLLICTPTVLVELNSKPETWILGEFLCKIIPFVELTVAHASVLTILAITFERYYAICEPLRAGYVCTKARALVICIITWFVAAICTSPIATISEYRRMEYFDGSTVPACFTNADTAASVAYFLLINTMFYLAPFVLLVFMYSVIARHLMADPGTNCSERAYNVRARKQVVAMLVTVVVSFFLCLLPFRLFTLWIILAPSQLLLDTKNGRYYYALFSCRIMLYLNSAVNPILYNLMSSKFRHGFKNVLPLCGRRGRRRRRWPRQRQRPRRPRPGGRPQPTVGASHSATLTHSSTRVTILGGTGSSLLRRSQIATAAAAAAATAARANGMAGSAPDAEAKKPQLQLSVRHVDHSPVAKDSILESADQPETFV